VSRLFRLIVWIILLLLAVFLVGPFLIPIAPLRDTMPASALADPDSRFIDINGLRVHYKQAGQGEPAMILLHGFASSVFSWREVMAPLSTYGTVVAFDRPAFGLTARPMPGEWAGESPYSPDAQVTLTIGLMDKLGIKRAILIGNSAGGTVAALTALRHPDRVQALILVSPAIYSGGGAPGFVRPLLRLPQMDRLGVLIARRFASFGESLGRMAWHDPSKLTPEIWAGYRIALRVDNWDRALWEFTKASRDANIPRQLSNLTVPVLVITGDDDRIVPTQQSIRLAGELPNAELVVVPNCGHVAHEEAPAAFMHATTAFLDTLTRRSQMTAD
jgi:pimeloyl-ACP methyl ester carboxylesterase